MSGNEDWWKDKSPEERDKYINEHPKTKKHNIGDEEIISKIKDLLSQKTDSSGDIERRREEARSQKRKLEEDPDEILKTIESESFKVRDPGIREEIQRDTQSDSDDDDYLFEDMQGDFDVEYAAREAIKKFWDQDDKNFNEPPEIDPTIFSSMIGPGKSFHDIVDMNLDDVTELYVKDSGGFVKAVHDSGFYKNPERVAAQIVSSKTWKDWLQKSKDKFIEDYVKGESNQSEF